MTALQLKTYLLFVGAASRREQQVVEIERRVAAVTWLAEGVGAIRVGGDRAVGAAEVRRHHLRGRRKRWMDNNNIEERTPLNSVKLVYHQPHQPADRGRAGPCS